MTAADHANTAAVTRHRGSCRVFYAEGICTCGADAIYWKERAEAAEREAQDARLARTVGIGTMKQRARAAEAERDRLSEALLQITDFDTPTATVRELARAALARTENTP